MMQHLMFYHQWSIRYANKSLPNISFWSTFTAVVQLFQRNGPSNADDKKFDDLLCIFDSAHQNVWLTGRWRQFRVLFDLFPYSFKVIPQLSKLMKTLKLYKRIKNSWHFLFSECFHRNIKKPTAAKFSCFHVPHLVYTWKHGKKVLIYIPNVWVWKNKLWHDKFNIDTQ